MPAGTTSNQKTLITGMNNTDHVTRTLLISRNVSDYLVISRGSDDNIDLGTQDIGSGRSQLKAFNLTELQKGSVDYAASGLILGWGLRNSVGLTEDAIGQIFTVENSADQVYRGTTDIHQDNPGEEMNYHGFINQNYQRRNYGYPDCLAVWDASVILSNGTTLSTGDQFVRDGNGSFTDADCGEEYRQAPAMTFQAHMAPLDIKFAPDGNAWISFHGSWDRSSPAVCQSRSTMLLFLTLI